MQYLGDFSLGSTVFFKFTTVNSTGAPTALSSGGVTVYRNASTVPDTTGVTLTASFNGVTGMNHVTIELSTAGFYSSAGTYMAIISSGAASESLAGYVLAGFSVLRKPTVTVSSAVSISTASLISTSNVFASVASATGIASAVWNATRSSYTAAGSFGESISTGSSIAALTWNINQVTTVSGNVSGNVVGSLGSLTTAAAVQVNAEVVDALNTDTYGEPAAGIPSTAAALTTKVGYLYAALRNKVTVSSSAKVFYTDTTLPMFGKVLTDDGSVYTEAEASTST